MTEERRIDTGNKIKDALYNTAITVILGLFIHTAWSTAEAGKSMGTSNQEKIAVQESRLDALQSTLSDIREDVKEIRKRVSSQ